MENGPAFQCSRLPIVLEQDWQTFIRLVLNDGGMADTLSDSEIDDRVPEGWSQEGEEIVRSYEFEEYLDGVEFATDIAELADEETHHPEITIRFDEVEVRLTSHEEGGVTEQDLEIADRFNDLS